MSQDAPSIRDAGVSQLDGVPKSDRSRVSRALPAEMGLSWQIKTSFVDYIARMSDGRRSVTEGAVLSQRGELWFESSGPGAEGRPEDSVMRFRGDVRFAGHHGFLFVRICDPWLHFDGPCGELSIVDPDPDADEGQRMVFCTFTAEPHFENPERIAGANVRLTIEGSDLFLGIYPPGDSLDDFSISTTPPDVLVPSLDVRYDNDPSDR